MWSSVDVWIVTSDFNQYKIFMDWMIQWQWAARASKHEFWKNSNASFYPRSELLNWMEFKSNWIRFRRLQFQHRSCYLSSYRWDCNLLFFNELNWKLKKRQIENATDIIKCGDATIRVACTNRVGSIGWIHTHAPYFLFFF